MPSLRLGLSQTQFPAGGIQAEGDGPEESSVSQLSPLTGQYPSAGSERDMKGTLPPMRQRL